MSKPDFTPDEIRGAAVVSPALSMPDVSPVVPRKRKRKKATVRAGVKPPRDKRRAVKPLTFGATRESCIMRIGAKLANYLRAESLANGITVTEASDIVFHSLTD